MFLDRYDMLQFLVPGGTFLLNAPYDPDQAWEHLPRPVQEQLIAKRARFYVVDAYKVAQTSGMRGRINTVMQVCFFAISGARRGHCCHQGKHPENLREAR
jgi:pyruvate-ferredoxin/flavodoxin oxidoreductase